MPTYEYACTSCGRRLEVVQSFSDPPLETCDECGARLKRVFHPVGIVLKGSGFYATDNRGKKPTPPKPKETATSSGESTPKSESKSEPKSESKPAPKSSGEKKASSGGTKDSAAAS